MIIPATSTLLQVADCYCAWCGLSRSRVSTIVFNDGKTLDRIAAGGDLNTRSYEKALRWFSENWPVELAWPEGVERLARHLTPQPEEARDVA
jgi:hypothetical protein